MDDCAYNKSSECHAMAITVGGKTPICDTCMKSTIKGGVLDMTAGVGACKVEGCKFNEMLECSASGIHVERHTDHAECNTFTAR